MNKSKQNQKRITKSIVLLALASSFGIMTGCVDELQTAITSNLCLTSGDCGGPFFSN